MTLIMALSGLAGINPDAEEGTVEANKSYKELFAKYSFAGWRNLDEAEFNAIMGEYWFYEIILFLGVLLVHILFWFIVYLIAIQPLITSWFCPTYHPQGYTITWWWINNYDICTLPNLEGIINHFKGE